MEAESHSNIKTKTKEGFDSGLKPSAHHDIRWGMDWWCSMLMGDSRECRAQVSELRANLGHPKVRDCGDPTSAKRGQIWGTEQNQLQKLPARAPALLNRYLVGSIFRTSLKRLK